MINYRQGASSLNNSLRFILSLPSPFWMVECINIVLTVNISKYCCMCLKLSLLLLGYGNNLQSLQFLAMATRSTTQITTPFRNHIINPYWPCNIAKQQKTTKEQYIYIYWYLYYNIAWITLYLFALPLSLWEVSLLSPSPTTTTTWGISPMSPNSDPEGKKLWHLGNIDLLVDFVSLFAIVLNCQSVNQYENTRLKVKGALACNTAPPATLHHMQRRTVCNAAPPATPYHMQCRTSCLIQNGCQGAPKWPTGSG